jgi:hypothetical protein
LSLIVKAPEKKKPTPWAKYTWIKDANGRYQLVVGVDTFYIWEQAGIWTATAHIDGQSYHAERPTFEEAAKAADRLLYKKLPKAWTVTDARAIIAWKGDLNFEEAKG